MTIPTFVVKGSALDLVGVDSDALESITFTPNTRGQVVSIGADLYRPEPVTVTLDTDGRMNGGDGVELLAALDSLDDPLMWRIQAYGGDGFARRSTSFWFIAPSDGETVWLGDITPSPQVSPTGITRGPRGVDDVVLDGNEVQFRFQGQPVGDPIPLWLNGIFGGFPSSTPVGVIFGGKP